MAGPGDKSGDGCKRHSGRSVPKNWDLEREGLVTHVAFGRHKQTHPLSQPPSCLTWFPAELSIPSSGYSNWLPGKAVPSLSIKLRSFSLGP